MKIDGKLGTQLTFQVLTLSSLSKIEYNFLNEK
jgi:hypothetical protein